METNREGGERRAVFFDSGIGGLNLLYECACRAPQIDYFFISDNNNVPYGNKSAEEILRLTLAALDGIEGLNPAALVVGCNTVTARCIGELRRRFSFPVVGIQPAVKQAAKVGGRCLVLATEATVKSPSFVALVNKFSAPQTKVVACEQLADYIERNIYNLPYNLPDSLLPMEEVDSVVLGCTHYAFVKESIQRKYNCPVFDGMAGTADHFCDILGIADHFKPPAGIFDHCQFKKLKITFSKGDVVKNRHIFENLFVLK